MFGPDDEELEDIEEEHLDGLHFGDPDPCCWQCWDVEDEDGDNPECPDL